MIRLRLLVEKNPLGKKTNPAMFSQNINVSDINIINLLVDLGYKNP